MWDSASATRRFISGQFVVWEILLPKNPKALFGEVFLEKWAKFRGGKQKEGLVCLKGTTRSEPLPPQPMPPFPFPLPGRGSLPQPQQRDTTRRRRGRGVPFSHAANFPRWRWRKDRKAVSAISAPQEVDRPRQGEAKVPQKVLDGDFLRTLFGAPLPLPLPFPFPSLEGRKESNVHLLQACFASPFLSSLLPLARARARARSRRQAPLVGAVRLTTSMASSCACS